MVAADDHAESLSGNKFWLSQLPGGLPADFDYGIVKTVADAKKLILVLPSCDRGIAAVGLYHHHSSIGTETAYIGLIEAWNHDHREILDAFGSSERFVAALKDVAPPHNSNLPAQIKVWRGAVVNKDDPLRCSIGPSWSRRRSVACWFALHDYVPALQPSLVPVVLHASIERSLIVALHNGRAEQEVILDAIKLAHAGSAVTLDGTELFLSESRKRLIDFCPDAKAFARLIADWRSASARYQHWKSVLELRRHLNAVTKPRNESITPVKRFESALP